MSEIILITGGAGCLGQHIIKHLQQSEGASKIKEIRVLDLVPYEKRLEYKERFPVKSVIGDICTVDSNLKEAFKDVHTVFHCAAFISISFPPKIEQLERVNVTGTENVLNLCIENNVKFLIYTSDILVTLIPFTKMGMFGAITVALRFPIMYGEEDRTCFTKLIELSEKWNGQIPKIAGDGGKHQLIYAGNAAWGHICARNTLLSESPEKVAGLPVSLTDESPIYDITRFANVMIARNSDVLKIRPSSWKIPFLVGFILAMIYEFFVGLLNKVTGYQLDYSPKIMISYCGSLTLSRMRASIQMDYDPPYTPEDAMKQSAKWYEKWYLEEFKVKKKAT
uniref:CSON004995 protein n=1 Tax=Culicoides sonorensis TaxID=179676 RepID=A0A336L505_CULSO